MRIGKLIWNWSWLFAFLLLMPFSAWAVTYNLSEEMQSGDWVSAYMYLGAQGNARAVVKNSNEWNLNIDFPDNHCNSYTASLIGGIHKYSARTKSVAIDGIKVRIDNDPVVAATGTLTEERGDNTLYLYFSFKEPSKVFSEIETGRVIRFQIPLGRAYDYEGFPLLGSARALARAHSLCLAHSDSRYFSHPQSSHGQQRRSNRKNKDYF